MRDIKESLLDIMKEIENIKKFTSGISSFDDFKQNEMVIYACINDVDKLTQVLKAIKQAKEQSEFEKMLEEIIKKT